MDARDEYVKCPACKGKGCKEWCDNEGLMVRWAAEAITTDGVVR